MFETPNPQVQRQKQKRPESNLSKEEFEQFYSAIYEEYGSGGNLTDDLPRRSAKFRSAAPSMPGQSIYTDSKKARSPAKKQQNTVWLIILVCLDLLGIATVVLLWFLQVR